MWKKNFFLLVSRTLAKLATIGVVVVAARVLGVEQFGLYNAILVLTMFAGLISDFGLVLPTIRSIAKSNEKENLLFSKSLSLRLVLSLISLSIITSIGFITQLPFEIILLLSIASIFEANGTTLIRTFEGIGKLNTVSFYTVFERLLYGALTILGIFIFKTIFALAVGTLIAHTIYLLVAVNAFQKKFGRLQLQWEWQEISEHLKLGLPLFLTMIFSNIYYRIDTLFITHYCSLHDVGIYNSAIRIIDAQMMVPLTMMASVFPHLSKLHHETPEQFSKNFFRYVKIFFLTGLLFAILTYAGAELIIKILYPTTYNDAVLILQIVSLIPVFYFMNALLSQTIIAMHKETWYTIVMFLSASLLVIGNNYFVPRYGIFASAWLRIVIELLTSIILFVLIQKGIRSFIFQKIIS